MQSYVHVLRTYMEALGRGDYAVIKGLFAADGRVRSPFLGEMEAGPFFDRLAEASQLNVITPIDIFVSSSESPQAVAYFQYDWTVKDGSLITFKVMDHFVFDAATGQVTLLDLIYDTHPIRVTHGDKYEASPL